MSGDMNRRRFLTTAVASAIGLQVGAKIALANPQDAAPMVFPPGPAPFTDMFPAVIKAVHKDGTVAVRSERDGNRLKLAPHGFADWDHSPGDRVTVLEDHEGTSTVRPLVEPVTAVPHGDVRKGGDVEVGGRTALVPNEAVVSAYRKIADRHSGRAVWLLSSSENGRLRVFGVLAPS